MSNHASYHLPSLPNLTSHETLTDLRLHYPDAVADAYTYLHHRLLQARSDGGGGRLDEWTCDAIIVVLRYVDEVSRKIRKVRMVLWEVEGEMEKREWRGREGL